MSGLVVDQSACIGCGKCVRACGSHGIVVTDRKAHATDTCTMCGACVDVCPVGAISIEKDATRDAADLAQYRNIWVLVQVDGDGIAPVAYELLGKAQELAGQRGQGCRVVALLPCGSDEMTSRLIAAGADEVIRCRDKLLAGHDAQRLARWVCELAEQRKPEIVLFGATGFGRELAPMVAAQLRTGLTADCTKLVIDPETGLLQQTRPAFGGNLMATIVCPDHRPQMATVRPGVMQAAEPDPARQGTVTDVELAADSLVRASSGVELLRQIARDDTESITDAETLVVIGRGIGSKKAIPLMQRLCDLIGAGLGCSRPLVESGWLEYSHQVGQTGVSVAPKLLISIGVSGAIQHLAGIGGAQTIVAINTDPDAPIFGVSQYSVVGDCNEVVRELVAQLENAQAASA